MIPKIWLPLHPVKVIGYAAVAQSVEHQLPKLRVAGSSPVCRSVLMDSKEIQRIKLRFGIVGNAEELNRAIDIAMQVAPTDLSVLVTGESGVGKEHFPQIIHQNSARKHNKYIAVNCGAIPEGTIDSELFGHVKIACPVS